MPPKRPNGAASSRQRASRPSEQGSSEGAGGETATDIARSADRSGTMSLDQQRVRVPAVVMLTSLVLAGCAASSPALHPGKPEVTISGTTIDKVKTALVAEMSKRKFRVGKETQLEMPFEQPASGNALQGLSAADAKGNPTERITYTLAPEGADIRIVADIVVVRKLAAMEKPIDITQGPEAQSVQGILDKIAAEVGTPKPKREN
ncbi:MAG: hypothetical protein WCD67_20850 [Xanthobacteraceae bacterium]